MSVVRMRRGAGSKARGSQETGALTRAQLRELEAELRRERARLERSLVGEVRPGASPDGDAHDGEIGLQAPANTDGGIGIALESWAHARHAAIVDALGRIEQGQYGRCATCQERIPYGRLLVMPEVQQCIRCGPGV